jgi:hypothetical protein
MKHLSSYKKLWEIKISCIFSGHNGWNQKSASRETTEIIQIDENTFLTNSVSLR